MTLEEFAKGIETNMRGMIAEQVRLVEAAAKAGHDPHVIVSVMNGVVAKVEREIEGK